MPARFLNLSTYAFVALDHLPHWRGRCLVFDGRETPGADLAPAGRA